MKKAPSDGPDEASLFLAEHCFLITAHLSVVVVLRQAQHDNNSWI
jgi:hypothetical protein